MPVQHIKKRLSRIQASIALDAMPPRIVAQPQPKRFVRILGAWRRAVARLAPGSLYRTDEMKWLDALPLLEAGLAPERYRAARYSRLPSGPDHQSVAFCANGRVDYLPDAHVPVMMPRIYLVRDALGEAWSKMMVDYPERHLRHEMQNKMRRLS